MNTVYEKLYEIVEKRMTEQGGKMPCSKQAFLYTTRVSTGECSIEEMKELSNMECVETAYLGIMGRLADAGAMKAYEMSEQQDKTKFLGTILGNLICSKEAGVKAGRIVENKDVKFNYQKDTIYEDVLGEQAVNAEPVTERRMVDRLYSVYLRMPKPVHRVVRKVTRKDK